MGGDIHISNALNRLLNLTDKLSQQKKDNFISSELFILAALNEDGSLARLLKQAGANHKPLKKPLMNYEAGKPSMIPMPKNNAKPWKNIPWI